MNRLMNRIALVTGSSHGMGYSIARRLAQEGAKVIICSRNENNIQEAKTQLASEGLNVTALKCNVSSTSDRKKLFEEAVKLGGLDILVSTVGVNPKSAITEVFDCPETAWDKIFEVNVKSHYLLSKEVLPLLKKSKAGRILYMSSLMAYKTKYNLGAYGVSKTALLGLTKQGAYVLAKHNITVNCLAPGLIDTNFGKVLAENKDELRTIIAETPLGRIGYPEEVSGVAAFLVSDDGSYITGENIVIAGGSHSRL